MKHTGPISARVNRRSRRALTLIEVIASVMLVSLVLLASLRCVGGVFASWRSAESLHEGRGLAQELMAEILQQAYEEPQSGVAFGRETGESSGERTNWDDVDDYHYWVSRPEDRNGVPLPGYSQWWRGVIVEHVPLDDPAGVSVTDTGLKRITVLVLTPSLRLITLVSIRSRWGQLQQPPFADRAVTGWMGNSLQTGGGIPLYSGQHLANGAAEESP